MLTTTRNGKIPWSTGRDSWHCGGVLAGLTAALGVLAGATVLVVDGAGEIVYRAAGVPRRAQVIAAIAPLLPAGAAR